MSHGLLGLLLAGGHGRRAGGPKALKPMAGQPLWRWQARRMRAAGCAHVAAVLHPTALWTEAEAHLSMVPADADAPMFASVQAGLRVLQGLTPTNDATSGWHRPLVLMLPVDCPMPEVAVVTALLSAVDTVQSAPWSVVRPRHEGRHGHPLLLAPAFVQRLLGEDPRSARLDLLIRALPARQALSAEVDMPGVLANFNFDGVAR
jgi:CTP:molybdopterin cytidylyltransferase MocA